MEKNTIIEFDGKDFALTDEVVFGNTKYFLATQLKYGTYELVENFVLFKELVSNGKTLFKQVTEKKELTKILDLFTKKFVKSVEEDSQNFKPGQIIDFNGREFVLLDNIIYEHESYMYLVTTSKPLDLVIGKRVNENGATYLIDVTETPEGEAVMQTFSNKHNSD